MRGEGGVAGEGRVVGVPKFHSWGKCTMPLMNINSDWMSNASSGLFINLCYLYYITRVLYFPSWGVTRLFLVVLFTVFLTVLFLYKSTQWYDEWIYLITMLSVIMN